MNRTKIEWTDYSWPIVNGCRRASPGCLNCYAERLEATRLRHTPKYRGLAVYKDGGPRWTGATRLWEPDLDAPLRRRGTGKVFVADMGDLFYEGVPTAALDRVVAVMLLAPRFTFQVLTKRAQRMRDYLRDPALYERVLHIADHEFRPRFPKLCGVGISDPARFPAPWIWWGVSVESQSYADERIPLLLDTPAAIRWVSAEPLLENVDLSRYLSPPCAACDVEEASGSDYDRTHTHERIDWVVVGGESGNKARPYCLSWARNILHDCAEAGVPCFHKQLGARPYETDPEAAEVGDDGHWPVHRWLDLADGKGGDPSKWPPGLDVREWPEVRS